MDLRDPPHDVVRGQPEGGLRVRVQGVEDVPGGMILGLEQRVEHPERGLHPVPRDLRETHPEEDPPDLLDVLCEDVGLPRMDRRREGSDVVGPDLDLPPPAGPDQLRGELGDLLFQFESAGDDLQARVRERDLPPDRLALGDDIAAGPEVLQDGGVHLLLCERRLREAGDHLLVAPLFVERGVPAVRDADDGPRRLPIDGGPPLPPHPPEGDGELLLGHSRPLPQRLELGLPVGLPELPQQPPLR